MIKKLFLSRLLLVVLVGGLVGCSLGATKIEQIRNDQDNYMGKTVTVAGTVEETINPPLGNTDFFKVVDDTGDIWVSTKGELPQKGSQIRVKGTVSSGVSIGTMRAGVIIKETPKR